MGLVDLITDHAVVCVADLTEAGALFNERFGLSSVEGGRHPGFGTANRIVPLGDTYIELVAVVDENEAGENSFGEWVAERARGTFGVSALCCRTDHMDEVAAKLGDEPFSMSRARPDGQTFSWRIAGLDAALRTGLPFVIDWGDAPHPGQTEVTHHAGEVRMSSISVTAREPWPFYTPNAVFAVGEPEIEVTLESEDGVFVL